MTRGGKSFGSFSVIGAARSGVAAAKLLKKKGYSVLLSDSGLKENIGRDFTGEIEASGIEAEFGGHSGRVYENDALVVSPGVPQDSDVIKGALSRGISVLSEVEAASWFCEGRIVSVTGTNGKTTTTTLIGEILKDAGFRAFVCGNIGKAFSEVADDIGKDGVAVVETSSFQLDNIKWFKPHVSVILNITPDHLDRYGHDFEAYISSKMKIIENQDEQDYLVFNYDDKIIRARTKGKIKPVKVPFSLKENLGEDYKMYSNAKGGALRFNNRKSSDKVIDTGDLIIKGDHNVYNSLASVNAVRILGVEIDSISRTLTQFKGVEHRLEFVRMVRGVKFYNDSKATNVNSVWYAIQGFSEPIVLILGGRDKGNDYLEILKEVRNHVKAIVALGESKQKIYDFFRDNVPVDLAADMEDAVKVSFKKAKEGEIVLLSPACASFDMFDNYEHRGYEFKRIVNSL